MTPPAWWDFGGQRREREQREDELYAARRKRNAERARLVTDDVYALRDELAGYTDMEFVVFARAVVAEVVRLRERVDALEAKA